MMKQTPKFLFLVLATVAANAALSISHDVRAQGRDYQKREAAVKDNMKYARRLEDIAAPVLMGNADQCGNYVVPYIGAQFATTDSVGEDYQAVMQNLYATTMQPTVTMIAAESPAATSLQIGDSVTHVNGAALSHGFASLDEIKNEIYQSKNAPLNLTIQRDGHAKEVAVTPVYACDVQVRLVNRDSKEVFIDDNKIAVTKALLKSNTDDAQIAGYIEQELLKLINN